MQHTLAFIGGGNMASSLIGGLLARGQDREHVLVADPQVARLESLKARYGVRVTQDNAAALAEAQIVVLAVKPQDLSSAVAGVRSVLERTKPLIISVAAGIRATDIQRWAGGHPVVRCMPNRAALNGCGITGLYATPDVTQPQRELAERVLGAVGVTLWVEHERDMDIVTALSGSGPAYFFLLIEMLEDAGVKLGLPPAVSRRLAVETAFGSGVMAHEAPESPATLRELVTSKGGTTEAALKVLEAHGIRDAFSEAIAAAARRSAELAEQFGAEPR
ncbi:MAG TPA: pyrroline-5-carboxylate reductase [Steroidobacteraceae bacterium]|jgi:pyrroline-5-carboxylate reductase